jgi:hypothetical protein
MGQNGLIRAPLLRVNGQNKKRLSVAQAQSSGLRLKRSLGSGKVEDS